MREEVQEMRREPKEGRKASFRDKMITPVTVLCGAVMIAGLTYSGVAHHEPARYYLLSYLIVVVAFILRALVWW
jgi:hypothetical protein